MNFFAGWLAYPLGFVKPEAWLLTVCATARHGVCQWLLKQLVCTTITQREEQAAEPGLLFWQNPTTLLN